MPAAADAGIPESRTLTIDLAEVESYPLSLNAMLARLQTAQQAVGTQDGQQAEADEALPETAPAEKAEDAADAVAADAGTPVEDYVEEVAFELDEEAAMTAEGEPGIVGACDAMMAMGMLSAGMPDIAYDSALLRVEASEDDVLITPVASFERTDIVVEETYTIMLMNSRVESTVSMPAQSFEGSTEAVVVKVEAGEGAFPAGTTMALQDIDDEDTLTDINAAAAGEAFVEVQRTHAVDITFFDAEGNRIEPQIPISVVMSIRETDEDEDTLVVHLDDAGNAEVVQDVASAAGEPAETLSAETPVESLSFVSDTFSVYAVVVTKKLETRTLPTAEGESYRITVTYTEEAAIPEGAALEVREIEGEAAREYLDQAESAVEDGQQIALARFFDIRIMDGEMEFQPHAPVMVTAELVNDDQTDLADAQLQAVHFTDEDTRLVEANETDEAVSFRAEGFSVWGVVYTVDFHYEVNGQLYDFSIPGGGYLSFYSLVEALGIAADDVNTEKDEIQELVDNVENIDFSDPGLLSISKIDEDTTTGAIKERLGLVCEYSAELTEEEIEEINAMEARAGDWALISLKPFDTEESLTVTMKNGDTWIVKVTDSKNIADLDELYSKADGKTKFILWTESNGVAYALKRDGTTAVINKNAIDSLSADYAWTIEYKYNSADLQYFCVRPSDSDTTSLGLYIRDEYNNPPLVLYGASEVNIRPKTDGKGGFEIEGWNYNKLVFDNDNKEITSAQGWDITPVRIKITEQNKSKFAIRVASEDFTMGYVSGRDASNVNQTETAEYQSITKDDEQKTNNNTITAVARSPKYLFDYWDLNGTRISNGAVINAGTLPIAIDGSVLTAHFRRNPNYEASDDEKQGRAVKRELGEWINNVIQQQVPLDDAATEKTAEVYDYENRIYRVDVTTRSNMKTFDGIVDLGFSIDWSGSMNFPSKIKQVTGFRKGQFDNTLINDLPLGDINSDYWHKTGWLDTNKTYYVITNRSVTADQFRIWYDPNDTEWVEDAWGNWHLMGKWKYSMAYYTENLPDKSTKITPDVRINAADGYLRDLTYAIYEDDSNGRLRVDDLRSSVSSTITKMNSILSQISLAKNSSDNPQVKIAWNDFNWRVPESHKTFQSVTNPNTAINPQVITEGGTRADLGLEDALNFGWEPNSRRYMVLITDGAPQPSSGQRHADQGGWTDKMVQDRTKEFARQLKENKGVTLLTIGLSMSDVNVGSVLLYDIASRDAVNEPYFYRADSGDELEYALYEILQTILKDAIVIGDVTDTVNEAFYPVDKRTGEALTPGAGQAYYIDLEGNAIRGGDGKPVTTAPVGVPYGKITPSEGTYRIEWVDQQFAANGWRGTVYEKAKEDFLGGNVVKTNKGEAEIKSRGYIVEGTNKFIEFNDATKVKGNKKLETPRVNVNELNFSENNTEWTVYLGTEIEPKKAIQALYDEILVEEVVQEAVDTDGDGLPDRISADSHNYAYIESARDDRETTGKPKTFYLKDLIDKLPAEEKAKLDWDEIIRLSGLSDEENTGVTLKYGVYDQDPDNAGTINIKLIRDHDPEKHVTDETGSPVETYTLVVEFSPEYAHRPLNVGGDGKYPYHTGMYGLKEAGNIAGKDTSTNVHVVNVFAKKLKIVKVDQEGNAIRNSPATFKLYREALEGEDDIVAAEDLPSLLPEGKRYILADTLTTDENGEATTSIDIRKLPDDAPYYLVETKAPDGYYRLMKVLEVRARTDSIDSSGTATPKDVWTKVLDKTEPLTSKTEWDPYILSNWEQNATIVLEGDEGTEGFVKREGSIAYDHNQTDDLTIVTYDIRNDAGARLPSTGGPGTILYTLSGVSLIALAAFLLARKRERNIL